MSVWLESVSLVTTFILGSFIPGAQGPDSAQHIVRALKYTLDGFGSCAHARGVCATGSPFCQLHYSVVSPGTHVAWLGGPVVAPYLGL